MAIIKCDYCGKEFTIKNKKAKFCSKNCYYKSERMENIYIAYSDYAEIVIDSKKHGKYYVFIDIEDIDKCKLLCWILKKDKNKVYIHAHNRFNQKRITLHRYIMDCPNDKVIDHINHNTLDNRKVNLRICTILENNRNKTSKINRNVYFMKKNNKYQVQIRYQNKIISGGYFKNIEEARSKAKEMRMQYFGEADNEHKESNN